jgi:hypothetical protein
MRVGWILRPTSLILISVVASAVLWSIPGQSEDLRGFAQRSAITLPAVLLLAGWYATCVVIVWICVKAGTRIPTARRLEHFQHSPRLESTFFWFITALATIGMLYCAIVISINVDVWHQVQTRQFNNLAHSLPEGAGFATLRYATAIAAPIGIYMWQRKNAPLAVAVWNVALLLVNVALASRLSLILALVVYAFLFISTRPKFKLKIWVAVAAIVIVFVGLTAFNYARNANYYENHGISNPLEMNLYQTSAYLGAPFQVSIGVANSIASGDLVVAGDPLLSLQAVAPTFIDFKKVNLGTGTYNERYGPDVSIASNLTTNSAFADTYVKYGWWGLAYTVLILAIAAFGFGVFARYRSVIGVIAALLLYGFAEYWRIFLYNQGILIFLLLASIAAAIFALALPWSLERWLPRSRVTRYLVSKDATSDELADSMRVANAPLPTNSIQN